MWQMLWNVITWLITFISGVLRSSPPEQKQDEFITVPRHVWDKVLSHGESITQDCDRFTKSIYNALSKESFSYTAPTHVPDLTKELQYLYRLSSRCGSFAMAMWDLKSSLSSYAIFGAAKDKVRIHRSQFTTIPKVAKMLPESVTEMCEDMREFLERWMLVGTFVDNETTMELLTKARKEVDTFSEKLITKLGPFCDVVIPELEGCKPEPYDGKKIGKKIYKLSFGPKTNLISNGMNMLAAFFIEEADLKYVLERSIINDKRFETILQAVRTYLGKEVLELPKSNLPEKLLLHLSGLKTSSHGLPFPLIFSLQMEPDILFTKLMNLDRLFPKIKNSSRNLGRMFLAELAEVMLKMKDNLPDISPKPSPEDDPIIKLGRYEAILEKCKKITPEMRQEYDQRMREVDGMKHRFADALEWMVLTLQSPKDEEIREKCRMTLLDFSLEIRGIIEKRRSKSPEGDDISSDGVSTDDDIELVNFTPNDIRADN